MKLFHRDLFCFLKDRILVRKLRKDVHRFKVLRIKIVSKGRNTRRKMEKIPASQRTDTKVKPQNEFYK